MTITLRTYTRNESTNALVLGFAHCRFWFSYGEIVAFYTPWTGSVVSENMWSRTTGKHLDEISPDKADRVAHHVFTELLDGVMSRIETALKYSGELQLMEALEHASEEQSN